ncbi:MAG: GNAT family N-acetyltransferase [Candidatus Lokiarchaeota archaeon]|nr:GNAT family N-acetyltransferase [Candidatus Lokiarchaeota archaeon]
MLEGNVVNLRLMEKEDISLIHEWHNNVFLSGIYNQLHQSTREQMEQRFTESQSHSDSQARMQFFIELKDGTKVGSIGAWKDRSRFYTMGASILPEYRKKGYCTEATALLIDYLFLSDTVERIQALANVDNTGSLKTLQKAGLQKEGILRNYAFVYGHWADMVMLSIVREEWHHPKVLKLPQ